MSIKRDFFEKKREGIIAPNIYLLLVLLMLHYVDVTIQSIRLKINPSCSQNSMCNKRDFRYENIVAGRDGLRNLMVKVDKKEKDSHATIKS